MIALFHHKKGANLSQRNELAMFIFKGKHSHQNTRILVCSNIIALLSLYTVNIGNSFKMTFTSLSW